MKKVAGGQIVRYDFKRVCDARRYFFFWRSNRAAQHVIVLTTSLKNTTIQCSDHEILLTDFYFPQNFV